MDIFKSFFANKQEKELPPKAIDDAVGGAENEKSFPVGLSLIVFSIVFIAAGYFYLRSSLTSYTNKSVGMSKLDRKITKKTISSKKPWETAPTGYGGNVTKEHSANLAKLSAMSKQSDIAHDKKITQETNDTGILRGYICTIDDIYSKYIGEYAMPYLKKGNVYSPIYTNASWNGKGVQIQKRMFAKSLDVPNSMAEFEKGFWLPLLSIANCILVSDNNEN